MDPLRRHDIERARATPIAEKARQTFALADQGIAMKRARLRAAYPQDSEEEIGERLSAWLAEPR